MMAAAFPKARVPFFPFSGRCKMLHRASGVVLLVAFSLLSVSLSVSGFAAEPVGRVQSASGTIMLRAVLAQSVSVSAEPQALMFDSFVSSAAERDFPVTFKTWWVRGPGSVSVVVFSSPQWGGVENGAVSIAAPASGPALEIESGKLPFSSSNKNEMIIIRAQAI